MLPSLHRLSLTPTGADEMDAALLEAWDNSLTLMELPDDVLEKVHKLVLRAIADPKEAARVSCKDIRNWCLSHKAACSDPAVFRNAMLLFGWRPAADVQLLGNLTMFKTFKALCRLWDESPWWFSDDLNSQGARGFWWRLASADAEPDVANTASIIVGASVDVSVLDTMDLQLRHRLRQPSCPLRDLYWARACYAQLDFGHWKRALFLWWVEQRLRARCVELGLPPPDLAIYSEYDQKYRWDLQDLALENAVFSIDGAFWNDDAWVTDPGWAKVRQLLKEGANPFRDPRPVEDGGMSRGLVRVDQQVAMAQNQHMRSVFQEALHFGYLPLIDAILDVAGGHVVHGWGLTIFNWSSFDMISLRAFSAGIRAGLPNAADVHRRMHRILSHLLSDGAEVLHEFARGEFGLREKCYRDEYYCHVNEQGEEDIMHVHSRGPIKQLIENMRFKLLLLPMENWPHEDEYEQGSENQTAYINGLQPLFVELQTEYHAVEDVCKAVEAQAFQEWQAKADAVVQEKTRLLQAARAEEQAAENASGLAEAQWARNNTPDTENWASQMRDELLTVQERVAVARDARLRAQNVAMRRSAQQRRALIERQIYGV